jgi:hypothetical protein
MFRESNGPHVLRLVVSKSNEPGVQSELVSEAGNFVAKRTGKNDGDKDEPSNEERVHSAVGRIDQVLAVHSPDDRIAILFEVLKNATFCAEIDERQLLERSALTLATDALYEVANANTFSKDLIHRARDILERPKNTDSIESRRFAMVEVIHEYMGQPPPKTVDLKPNQPPPRIKPETRLLSKVKATLTICSSTLPLPVIEPDGALGCAWQVIATWGKRGQWSAINGLLKLWALDVREPKVARSSGKKHPLADWYKDYRKSGRG